MIIMQDNDTDIGGSEDEDDSDEEDQDINIEYEYTEQSGTFKGNKPTFVHAVTAIKDLFTEKKGGDKAINKHKISVKDMRDIEYGKEIDIEIFDGQLKGLARMNIWGPSQTGKGKKKNKCTIMTKRYPGYGKEFPKMVSVKIIKPLLDCFLKGENWDNLFKTEVPNKKNFL